MAEKKVVEPAFGCTKHPKAGPSTQHPFHLILFTETI